MPATRKTKSKSPKKSSADDVTELISSASRLSLANKPVWYSANFELPYTIVAFNDEVNPVRHLTVEIFAPTVPTSFIRTVEVLTCGTKLKVEIGAPRWFYEQVFMERKLGNEYHGQHAGVEHFTDNVVQPVRSKYKTLNPWIEGMPMVINLPEKCQAGDVAFTRGTFLTRDVDQVGGMDQYNWVISVNLKTTKKFEVRNEAGAAVDYAAGGAL